MEALRRSTRLVRIQLIGSMLTGGMGTTTVTRANRHGHGVLSMRIEDNPGPVSPPHDAIAFG
jgi:hypothetical protein